MPDLPWWLVIGAMTLAVCLVAGVLIVLALA